MSRTNALILLGILVMLAPFSGLPLAFRTLLTLVFGAIVLGIGLTLRAQEVRQAQSAEHGSPTEESIPEPVRHTPTSISPI